MELEVSSPNSTTLVESRGILFKAEPHLLNLLLHLRLEVALAAGRVLQEEHLQDEGGEDAAHNRKTKHLIYPLFDKCGWQHNSILISLLHISLSSSNKFTQKNKLIKYLIDELNIFQT